METIHLFIPAILGSVLLALIMALFGIFIIWRRMIFVGIALSQMASLGTIVGHIFGFYPVICGFMATVAGAGIINATYTEPSLHKDNVNALLYVLSQASALLLLTVFPAIEAGSGGLFAGNLLYLTDSDLAILIPGAIVFFVLIIRNKRRWITLAVHQEEGLIRDRGGTILFYLLLAVSLSLASKWAGLLYTFGALLCPGLFASIVCISVRATFLTASVYAVLMSLCAMMIALCYDLPPGLVTVLLMGCGVIVSKIIKVFLQRMRIR